MNLRPFVSPFLLLCLALPLAAADPVRVLVWDEQQPEQKQAYGDMFLGETIAAHLASLPGLTARSVSLDSPDQGLDAATLDQTDVLIWWGHVKHQAVQMTGAERVVERVRDGRLGLIALHSAHWARPFVRLMQERARDDARASLPEAERATAKIETVNHQVIGVGVAAGAALTPSLEKTGDGAWRLTLPACVFPGWRADGAPGHVTTLLPQHPIAAGLPRAWDVKQTEMYNEPFHVPAPDSVIFEERWDRGEHFRSGCVWKTGKGRVFYFRPGHETYPVYRQPEPLRVLENAVRWMHAEAAR
jgi:trehalose utilization protein